MAVAHKSGEQEHKHEIKTDQNTFLQEHFRKVFNCSLKIKTKDQFLPQKFMIRKEAINDH